MSEIDLWSVELAGRLPLPYEIDPTRRLVVWTHTAAEPAGVWTRTLEQILADPLFAPGFRIIEDLRDDPDSPESSDVRKGVITIRRFRERLGRCRWAVLLRPESVATYGMLRMAEILLDDASVTLRPFVEMADALAWVSKSGASESMD
jgi:hypothetical protein